MAALNRRIRARLKGWAQQAYQQERLRRLLGRLLRGAPGLKAALRGLARPQPGRPLFVSASVRPGWEGPELAGTGEPYDYPLARPGIAPAGRWHLIGHLSGSYSLAVVNRGLARALLRGGAQVTLECREGTAQPPRELPPGEAPLLLPLLRDPGEGERFELYHHYPLIVPGPRAAGVRLRLALFFWEESRVPRETVALLNQHYDGVLVASRFVEKALVDSGCRLPVGVMPLGVEPPPTPRPAAAGSDRPFTFLHLSSCFPRKGVDLLLAAFFEAFGERERVALVIKTFPNPHNQIHEQLARVRRERRKRLTVRIIEEELSPEQMQALYAGADAVVLPTRGEGFNLPAAEALAHGLPLVVTGYGGHSDFCVADSCWPIDYWFDYARSHLAVPGSLWVEPDLAALTGRLRELFAGRGSEAVQARARRGAARVAEQLTWAGSARALQRFAELLAARAPRRQRPRLVLVSSWGGRCGIAEYSRQLVAAIPPEQIEVRLFGNRGPAERPGDPPVARLWDGGPEDALPDLLAELERDPPELLLMQHHFAWFDLFAEPLWDALDRLRGRGTVVLVTMHATKPLETWAPAQVALFARRAARLDRLLVHTLEDLNRLKYLGLAPVTTLLPQGVPAPVAADGRAMRRRLGIPEAAEVIGSYGFLLPHKGVAELIRAFALLPPAPRPRRLLLVTAQRDDGISAAEQKRCAALAEALGVAAAVSWYTEFLPQEASLELLAACDLVVFPYQITEESSSAAVRCGLAAMRPVLTTPLPIFDEVREVTLRAAECTARALMEAMAAALAAGEDPQLRERQGRWVAAHQWWEIAANLADLCEGAAAGRAVQRALAPAPAPAHPSRTAEP